MSDIFICFTGYSNLNALLALYFVGAGDSGIVLSRLVRYPKYVCVFGKGDLGLRLKSVAVAIVIFFWRSWIHTLGEF